MIFLQNDESDSSVDWENEFVVIVFSVFQVWYTVDDL